MKPDRLLQNLGGIGVLLALFGAWAVITKLGLVSPVFLPSVGDTFGALLENMGAPSRASRHREDRGEHLPWNTNRFK